jgi:hypothetical protein
MQNSFEEEKQISKKRMRPEENSSSAKKKEIFVIRYNTDEPGEKKIKKGRKSRGLFILERNQQNINLNLKEKENLHRKKKSIKEVRHFDYFSGILI